jgi:hypothetical protein
LLSSVSSTAWPGNGFQTPKKKGKSKKPANQVQVFFFFGNPGGGKKTKKKEG